MKSRSLYFFLAIIAASTAFLISLSSVKNIYALGGSSSNGEANIPLPSKNYPAEVVDISGNKISAERISMNGKIYFQAMIGKSDASIPFDKVKTINIKSQASSIDKDYYHADVELKDEQIIPVLFSNEAKLYGEAKFGKFQLFFRDIRTISFP